MAHHTGLDDFGEVKFKPVHLSDANGTVHEFKKGGVPVVFLHHLTAVLDDWDPRVVDGLAAKHHVIAFDNRGVGGSGGSTPKRSRRWLGMPSRS